MIVLDASALVDMLALRDQAEWVADRVRGETVVAPAHQPAEVLSATGRLRRAGVLDDDAWRTAVRELAAFTQELVLPRLDHLERARALSGRIRVVDGLYVALAEERGCPLVTTEEGLSRAQAPCRVVAPDA